MLTPVKPRPTLPDLPLNQMATKDDKKQNISLSQIAQAAGVSKMTVSRVLRDADGVSEPTRVRVMQEVERHGYVPNRLAATFGATQASTLIGVCVPHLSGYLVTQALENLDRTFERLGYQMIIGSHNYQQTQEEVWLKNILSWRPAGVLLSHRYHSKNTLKLLREASVPVLEFWNLNTSPIDMSVGFNEFDAGLEMSQHAIFKGYSKPAVLLAASDDRAVAPDRVKGFCSGFDTDSYPDVHTEILKDEPGFYAGYYGTELLLNHTQDVDMIYYMDDAMAIGGLAWCQKKGIRVPDDIGIAGWGGYEAASILPQRLTTTAIPVLQIGKLAAEQMAGSLVGEPVHKVTAVNAKLIDGETL